MNSNVNVDRHEEAEQVAPGIDDVAHITAHRSLVAGQQVCLFAGHHAFAAIGHPGPVGDAVGLALVAAELGALQRLASGPRLGGGLGRRRDRALFRDAPGLAALGRGPALGAGAWRTLRRARSRVDLRGGRCHGGVVCALVMGFLTAQQLHSRQVTSRMVGSGTGPERVPRSGCAMCVGAILRPTLTSDERLPLMDDGSTGSDDAVGGLAPGRLQLPAMRVLVAPDCFGDSLSAVEAAAAIATGWTRSRPGDRFIVAPQSDGGPGFIEVLAKRLGERRRLRVSGPLDDMVDAEWVFDPGPSTAYLECAQACGLPLLGCPPSPETALAAHSAGVGQLIVEALRVGATRIVIGLGGSACTDGGQAMISELGGLDAAREKLADIELIVASDTEYPLVGPWGAARVFGPQKGADTAAVAALEVRLESWALKLEAVAGRDVSSEPGAAAAGGIGAGLFALGGRCESGRGDHRRAHRPGRRSRDGGHDRHR